MNAPKIVTLDIETRPNEVYAWGLRDVTVGINQIIRPGGIIMVAAQWHGQKKVTVRSEWDADGYEGMIRWAWDVYNAADYVVTFNGARFDNSHLRAAWAELGLTPPAPHRDIDLFRTVRKFNWPSRKLEFCCKQLGLPHKTDPGGFSTWTDILTGEGKKRDAARKRMADYCANDVKITTALYDRLLPWIDGLNVALINGTGDDADAPVCNRCGSESVIRKGTAHTNSVSYKRYLCNGCGGWLRGRKSMPHRTALVGV
jgi:DNA polymerase elongation subunit (family B)